MEELKLYIISLYKDIPQEVYEGLLSVLCVGITLFIVWKGSKTGLRYSALLLLVEYIFLILCSTVIFRTTNETRHFDFHPFWSYQAIQEGKEDLLAEIIMNVVVFVPIGLLLGCISRNIKWWHTLLMGCGISLSIEALQFILHRGFSEFDDFMHNALGCLIGYGIYSLFRIEYEKFSKRPLAVL